MSQASEQPSLEADLVTWGRVITLETRGRRSGQTRRVTVGFVEEAGGALVVAAASESSHWARNLLAHPACHTERAGRREARTAVQLTGADHDDAVRSLILKYGTPSERLGSGPAFRLHRSQDPT